MKSYKRSFVAFLLLSSLFFVGCPTSRSLLRTGIRLRGEFIDSVFLIPSQAGTGIPIPGTHVTGAFLRYDSGPHGGGQEILDGYTESDGFRDFPDAITGAFWNFGADFTISAMPACGAASDPGVDVFFPVAQENFTCHPSPIVE